MAYPLIFRPNHTADLYDVANVKLAGPFDVQVFKPLLATSMNSYTLGGVTIFPPGATIIRALVQQTGQTIYDIPGGAQRYFIFLGLPGANKKWRVVSGFCWAGPVPGVFYNALFLGEFV